MIRSVLLALAIGAATLGTSACDNTGVNTENLAEKSSENTYVARQYGITATAPEGWYVMDSDVTKKLIDVGRDVTIGKADDDIKASFDASIARTHTIFGFLEFNPTVASEGGASITALAEDISVAPEVKTGSDYFEHMRVGFQQSSLNASVADGYSSTQIDGKNFDRMDVVLHATGPAGQPIQVQQRYIAAKHNDDMVVFIQSYLEEDDLATLDGVLKSVKLDW